MKRKNKGFSMVELIIVIAIMAVLAAALAPQLIKYVRKSRRTRDIDSANEICKAYERAAVPMSDVADDGDDDSDGDGILTSVFRYDTNFNDPPTDIEDYVYIELGDIPDIATYKDYYWYVEYKKENGHVSKVAVSPDTTGSNLIEVYPDSNTYLEQGTN